MTVDPVPAPAASVASDGLCGFPARHRRCPSRRRPHSAPTWIAELEAECDDVNLRSRRNGSDRDHPRRLTDYLGADEVGGTGRQRRRLEGPGEDRGREICGAVGVGDPLTGLRGSGRLYAEAVRPVAVVLDRDVDEGVVTFRAGGVIEDDRRLVSSGRVVNVVAEERILLVGYSFTKAGPDQSAGYPKPASRIGASGRRTIVAATTGPLRMPSA